MTSFLVSQLPIAQHLGKLHAWEHVLVLLLAFGPFVVLGVVVWLRRRADARDD